MRQSGGHLPGAYLHNEKASGLIWYFSTIGVHAIALDGKHDQSVRDYLDRYLATATRPGGAIDDVQNLKAETIEWKLSDSDDSYAAGVLSLACWYSHSPAGTEWFNAKLKQLKFIATANLVDAIDPKHNLTRTYNRMETRFTEPLVVGVWNKAHDKDQAAKNNYRDVCQLMDNCEAYRGLKDFADRLVDLKDRRRRHLYERIKHLVPWNPSDVRSSVAVVPSQHHSKRLDRLLPASRDSSIARSVWSRTRT